MQKTFIGRIDAPSGGASSFLFSNIPNTFAALLFFCSVRSTADLTTSIKLNGSTSGFESRRLQGDGSSVVSRRGLDNNLGFVNWSATDADVFSSIKIFIPNYASSDVKQLMIDTATERTQTSATYTKIEGAQWSVTDPITSFEIYPGNDSFTEFSSIALYGIKAGSDGITTIS